MNAGVRHYVRHMEVRFASELSAVAETGPSSPRGGALPASPNRSLLSRIKGKMSPARSGSPQSGSPGAGGGSGGGGGGGGGGGSGPPMSAAERQDAALDVAMVCLNNVSMAAAQVEVFMDSLASEIGGGPADSRLSEAFARSVDEAAGGAASSAMTVDSAVANLSKHVRSRLNAMTQGLIDCDRPRIRAALAALLATVTRDAKAAAIHGMPLADDYFVTSAGGSPSQACVVWVFAGFFCFFVFFLTFFGSLVWFQKVLVWRFGFGFLHLPVRQLFLATHMAVIRTF
jgi:hypothetical protein